MVSTENVSPKYLVLPAVTCTYFSTPAAPCSPLGHAAQILEEVSGIVGIFCIQHFFNYFKALHLLCSRERPT